LALFCYNETAYLVPAVLFLSFVAGSEKTLLSKEPAGVTVNPFEYTSMKFDNEAEDGY
jgi:hypothetical protein